MNPLMHWKVLSLFYHGMVIFKQLRQVLFALGAEKSNLAKSPAKNK